MDDVDEIGERIGELLKPELPVGLGRDPGGLGKLLQLKSRAAEEGEDARRARRSSTGATTSTSNRLPGLQTWPDDGGIFHNFGLTHTKHPETGKRNLGLYRLQQHSHNTLGMHWQIHKDSTAHHAVAERLRRAAAGGDRDRLRPGRHATRPPRRCPATSTSTCSPGSCAASGSRWSTA